MKINLIQYLKSSELLLFLKSRGNLEYTKFTGNSDYDTDLRITHQELGISPDAQHSKSELMKTSGQVNFDKG